MINNNSKYINTHGGYARAHIHTHKNTYTHTHIHTHTHTHTHTSTHTHTCLHIEGFQPEWCISTIYHAWDTPFWSGTLDILTHTHTHTWTHTHTRMHVCTCKFVLKNTQHWFASVYGIASLPHHSCGWSFWKTLQEYSVYIFKIWE